MARIGDKFPSKYLKASDLENKVVTVTIDRVVDEQVGKDREWMPVVYFAGHEKGVVLNKTNGYAIAGIIGSEETDEWRGHRVALFSTLVEFQGKSVPSIRIKAPLRAAIKPVPKPDPVPEPEDIADAIDDDGEIPF